MIIVGIWLSLARIGGFAVLRSELNSGIPGARYSFTFIPPGEFCDNDGRCFFIDLDGRTMTPVLKDGMTGVTYSIANSASPLADFKASFNSFSFEIIVRDGDTMKMRALEVDDGNWHIYRRKGAR